MIQVPFGSRAYLHRSLPISAQNLINYWAEIQEEDAKGRVTLHPHPGLKLFSTCGTGPVRGLHNWGGTPYAVSGNKLYSIDINGTATLKATGVTGSGRVVMDHNATQLAIATAGDAFTFDGTTLSQITDAEFEGVNTCVFQHQRIIWDGAGGNFQLSELNDAGSYVALNIAEAEGRPDDTIAVKAKGDELWLFGEGTIELWSDIGGGGFPYQRSPGAVIEVGLNAVYSVTLHRGVMYWLGHDLQIYAAADLSAHPISTPAMADAIQGYSKTDDCVSFAYAYAGQDFIDFTFRNAQRTWSFCVKTGMWSEKSYYDTSYVNNRAAHRANCHCWSYSKNLVGDFEDGNIYVLDGYTYTDNGTIIRREATAPPLHANGQRLFFSGFRLDYETGRGLVSGQGSNPKGYLSWSDDGGRTWGADIEKSLGASGEYDTQVEWIEPLGMTEDSRIYRYWTTEPIPGSIIGAYSTHEVSNG